MFKFTSIALLFSFILIGCSNSTEPIQENEQEIEDSVVQEAVEKPKEEQPILIPVRSDEGDYSYVDENGKTIIEGPLVEARDFSEGLSFYSNRSEGSFFINEKGEKQFAADFYRVGNFNDGLATFCEDLGNEEYDLQCGYLDKDGNIAINPIYNSISDFSQGKALGIYENEEGQTELHLISKDGNSVHIPNVSVENYWNFTSFANGVAVIYSKNDSPVLDINLIDLDGQVTKVNKYEEVGFYSEGLLPVLHVSEQHGAVWGFINGKGEEVIPPKYKEVTYFTEGLAFVKQWEDEQDKWTLIDEKGNAVSDSIFEDVKAFTNGLAPVQIDGLWGYVDKKGKIVIEPQFTYAAPFVTKLAEVYVDDQNAYIDQNGTYIIPPANQKSDGNGDQSWKKATAILWEYLEEKGIDKASGNILEQSKKTQEGTFEFELYGPEIISDPETGEGHRNYFGKYGVTADGQVYKYEY